MTALEQFLYAGQQVRTVIVDGDPWFVAADVARILGYSATAAMTRSMDDDEKGVRTLHTPGGEQEMTVVNEPGLYSAIIRSTIPQAREFKRWITHDVLPTIRKTGRYGSDVDMLAALPSSAALKLAAEAAARAEALEAENRVLAPKAERWDELASAGGDFSVGDAAKMLARAGVETGQNRLFDALDQKRWTFRRGGVRRAMQAAVEAGYVTEKAQRPRQHPETGELIQVAPQVRVTGKGLDRLAADFGVGVSSAVVVS